MSKDLKELRDQQLKYLGRAFVGRGIGNSKPLRWPCAWPVGCGWSQVKEKWQEMRSKENRAPERARRDLKT